MATLVSNVELDGELVDLHWGGESGEWVSLSDVPLLVSLVLNVPARSDDFECSAGVSLYLWRKESTGTEANDLPA